MVLKKFLPVLKRCSNFVYGTLFRNCSKKIIIMLENRKHHTWVLWPAYPILECRQVNEVHSFSSLPKQKNAEKETQ